MFANISDKTLLSLPIGEHLDKESLDQVICEIKDRYEKC